MKLNIKNTFSIELPADTIIENYPRQVANICFSFVQPSPCPKPFLIHYSKEVLAEIGLTEEEAQTALFVETFSGNAIYPQTQPYAMCYGGHQFGHWAGQLGDGRAINLFEIEHKNKRWALQLKGAGRTPYSRTADGLAVLRSSIREYLCSEAMYHLGVPTTRALSLILSGEAVWRDMLYNGNPAYEKGAIVCRVAPNFIRFGNFQILTARKEWELLKRLTDYTIRYFYPHLGEPSKETYIAFLKEVAQATMDMVLHWERVGFVHGVMNTDNMSIMGLTIDYGPYGWLEDYDPNWTPNTTDAEGKRYRFGNQAYIAFWNVYQLANALFPLIEEAKPLEDILNDIQKEYIEKRNKVFLKKLGLPNTTAIPPNFIEELEQALYQSQMDMTLFFRTLSDFDPLCTEAYIALLKTYSYAANFEPFEKIWSDWLEKYANYLSKEINPNRKAEMNQTNPKYVLRNYMAQLAIEAAEKEDYTLIDELYQLLKNPYSEQPDRQKWFAKRPEWAKHKIGCSMLSCSS